MASGFYGIFLGNSEQNLVAVYNNGTSPETDGNWANKDGSVFVGVSPVKSLWTAFDGASIHCSAMQDNGRISYSVFSTSSETWTTSNETVSYPGETGFYDAIPNFIACAISYRSTATPDVVLFARVSDASAERVFGWERTSGTWTALSNTGPLAEGGIVAGDNDYDGNAVFYGKNTTTAFSKYSQADGSAFIVGPGSVDTGIDTATHLAIPGPTQSIPNGEGQCCYIDADDKISLVEDQTTTTAISANTVYGNGRTTAPFAVACLVPNGTDLHLFYSNADDTQDLYHAEDTGSGWGNETEIQDAVTCNRISARMGTSDINYFWQDGATTKFGAFVLSAGVTVSPGVTTLEMTIQTPTIASGASVDVPVTDLDLVLQTPIVATGASVAVPVTTLELILQTPTIETGVAVLPGVTTLEMVLFEPTIDAKIPVNILPGVTALEMVMQTPVVASGVNLSVPLTALELVLQTPAVATGASALPGVTTLEMTLQAPTIETGVNIGVPVTTLELTLPAPAVGTSVAVDVPVTTLEMVLFAPTIVTGAQVEVLPPVTTLEMVLQTPAVAAGESVAVPVIALEMVLQTPTVETGVNAQVPVTALELVLQTPTIETGVEVLPGVTTLEMTLFAPSIETGVEVLPGVTTLELVLQTPTIETGVTILPSVTDLDLVLFAPTITTTTLVEVLPPVTTLEMVLQTPTIETGVNTQVPVTTLEMVLQTPTIETGVNVDTPVTTLELVLQTPVVGTGVEVLPGVTTLEMVLQTPTIETGVAVLPPVTALELVLQAPAIQTGVEVLPGVTTLEMTLFVPTIQVGVAGVTILVPNDNVVSKEYIDADWNDNTGDNDLTTWDTDTQGGLVKANSRIEVTVDGAGGDDIIDKTITSTNEKYCSFDFTLVAGHTFADGEKSFGTGLSTADVTPVCVAFGVTDTSGVKSWTIQRTINGSENTIFQIDSNDFPVVDDRSYGIELRYFADTSNGVIQAWIDGEIAYSETGVNTDFFKPIVARVGHRTSAFAGVGTPALDFYVDNFFVGDSRRSMALDLFEPAITTGVNIQVPATTMEMTLQLPVVGSGASLTTPVTTMEMAIHAPIVPSTQPVDIIMPSPTGLQMVIQLPRVDMILPFTESAGMFDIGSLNRPQVPVFPYGTVLTDRADGNAYLLDINLPFTETRMSDINIRNGLRVYPTYSPRGGPVVNGWRIYSENKQVFTEKVTGQSVSNPPVHNLTADSSSIYELEMDDNGNPEWTLV